MSATSLEDDLGEIYDLALAEPEVGLTFWSFHEKDRATPLEFDEALARLTQGAGVYAIELVFDENLDLYQRGSGRKVKDAAALRALKRERVDALAPPMPKASLPVPSSTTRKGPLHGALLAIDDDAPSAPSPKKKSAAALAAKKAAKAGAASRTSSKPSPKS